MISYQIENPYDIKEELTPLIEDHYKDDPRKDIMPLSPDFEAYKKLCDEGKLVFVTVRDSDKLVGYCCTLLLNHNHCKEDVIAHVELLYTAPEYRGTGIASTALVELERALKESGVKQLFVTFRHNDKTHNYLDGMGFSLSEVVYSKSLGN